MKYYLTIDAGTSVIKTVIFNVNFKQVISHRVNNPVIIDNLGKSELDMYKFWKFTSKCIKSAILNSKINQVDYWCGITGNMVGL